MGWSRALYIVHQLLRGWLRVYRCLVAHRLAKGAIDCVWVTDGWAKVYRCLVAYGLAKGAVDCVPVTDCLAEGIQLHAGWPKVL